MEEKDLFKKIFIHNHQITQENNKRKALNRLEVFTKIHNSIKKVLEKRYFFLHCYKNNFFYIYKAVRY